MLNEIYTKTLISYVDIVTEWRHIHVGFAGKCELEVKVQQFSFCPHLLCTLASFQIVFVRTLISFKKFNRKWFEPRLNALSELENRFF